MAPTTPPSSPKRTEYTTIDKCRFFDAYDRKKSATSLGQICRRRDIDIKPSTARTWLKKREILGSGARRRTRKLSNRLGRKSTVSESVLDTITDQDNPIHEELYAAQVKKLDLKCQPRTLQHYAALAGAKRYKKAYTTEISD
ncbi:hypothetical protein EJ08DRAFT_711131 [Tothia fuscella]|uniref:Uncharacterized protein n=1 Tax=Tothia fuscella TaxID=1048955 RepID=A0A9P4NDU6_9PEZI|nr:hypothetical protein EJ08DRAFT_711131 [Tothia fuscella]